MPYGPRLSQDEILQRVRQRLEDGRLPVALSSEIIAGYGGAGDMCCVCDEEITSAHIEYELDDPRDHGPLTFHLSCHAVWQLECVRRISEQKPDPDNLVPRLLRRIQR